MSHTFRPIYANLTPQKGLTYLDAPASTFQGAQKSTKNKLTNHTLAHHHTSTDDLMLIPIFIPFKQLRHLTHHHP